MREMKDSGIEWIGAIPAAWGVHRIASHFQEIKEKNTDNAYSNALQFKMGRIIAKPQKWDEDETNETYSAYTVVHPNTIMINGLNLEFDFVTQRVAQVECDGIITSAYIALSPRGDINAEYICYLLKSYDACRAFHSMGRGLRKILSYSELKNKPIVIPPLAEQERIAAFLDAECAEIDAVLEKTRASIEEYKKLKQAVITQAVTKGVRGDRPMKDSGIEWIGEIPESWEVSSVRYIGQLQNGISKGGEFFGKGFPFVSYGDVYKNYELPHSVSGLIDTTEDERATYSVEYGDIFFTRTSETIEEVGFSCVCKRSIPNATFAGFIIRLRPFCADEKILTDYAKYYFRGEHIRAYLVKEMNLVTRASLGQTLLKGMSVIVPPKSVQKEIAEYLDDKCADIDALVAKKQQYLTEIENYKKSLIYEYVTGKRRLYK